MSGTAEVEEIKLGDVEFSGNNIATPGVKFDKIAVDSRDQMLMVSLIAESQRIKQIRAILQGGAKALIQASGIKVTLNGKGSPRTPGRIFPTPDGYVEHKHKLGFAQAHAMFFTKLPGYMKIVTPESLWQELTTDRFTTPILREWMPYIEKELRRRGLLEDAWTYRCQCGVLSATTSQIDEIVSEGIRWGAIHIRA
jgi:hypothetical protein